MDDDDDVIVAPEFDCPTRALFPVYREVFMLEDGCAARRARSCSISFFHFTSFSLPDFSDWQRPGREDGSAQGRGSQCADLLGKLAAKPPLRAHQRKRHAFPRRGDRLNEPIRKQMDRIR